MNAPHDQQDGKKAQKPSFLALMLTTFAAAFGVQSDKNRERDFNQSSILPFILSGVIFTVLFVLALLWLVNTVVN